MNSRRFILFAAALALSLGQAAAHDVELLARATHAFVGTHVSSLSFLMYARAAFRAAAARCSRRPTRAPRPVTPP